MSVIAIVPARSGSKRLPRKNTLALEPGISLVQHAINCAIDSGVIDHVSVLTDDPNMLFEHAHLILESAQDANDTTDIATAVSHAADIVERSFGYSISHVVTLQPAVVARSPLIVKKTVEAARETRAGGAVTVARTVPWVWKTKDGQATTSWGLGPYPRSSEAPDHFVEINAVQVANRYAVDEKARWRLPLLLAELPHWCAALDIDDPWDMVRVRDLWPWAKTRLETWIPKFHMIDGVNA